MPKFASLVCALLLASLGTVALSNPAEAARPSITLSAPSTATTGTTVTVRGTLTRASKGLKLTLQTRSGSRWTTVKRKDQGTRRTFSFPVAVKAGTRAYRVVSTKTKKLSKATSRVVRINGLSANLTELDRARARILADTNAYRSAKGLPALRAHVGLNSVAQAWAGSMAASNSMVHNTKLAAQTPGQWRRIGENIGMGWEIGTITAKWYASPGHKANILGDFTHLGIGFVRDKNGTAWYVQDFAKY